MSWSACFCAELCACSTNLYAHTLTHPHSITHIRAQIALLGAGTATREAAVIERVAAVEGATEERALRLRAEVQR